MAEAEGGGVDEEEDLEAPAPGCRTSLSERRRFGDGLPSSASEPLLAWDEGEGDTSSSSSDSASPSEITTGSGREAGTRREDGSPDERGAEGAVVSSATRESRCRKEGGNSPGATRRPSCLKACTKASERAKLGEGGNTSAPAPLTSPAGVRGDDEMGLPSVGTSAAVGEGPGDAGGLGSPTRELGGENNEGVVVPTAPAGAEGGVTSSASNGGTVSRSRASESSTGTWGGREGEEDGGGKFEPSTAGSGRGEVREEEEEEDWGSGGVEEEAPTTVGGGGEATGDKVPPGAGEASGRSEGEDSGDSDGSPARPSGRAGTAGSSSAAVDGGRRGLPASSRLGGSGRERREDRDDKRETEETGDDPGEASPTEGGRRGGAAASPSTAEVGVEGGGESAVGGGLVLGEPATAGGDRGLGEFPSPEAGRTVPPRILEGGEDGGDELWPSSSPGEGRSTSPSLRVAMEGRDRDGYLLPPRRLRDAGVGSREEGGTTLPSARIRRRGATAPPFSCGAFLPPRLPLWGGDDRTGRLVGGDLQR